MESYRRKKQPELVKKQLIEAGVSIALKRGLAAVTVQGVSEMAGVTKAGSCITSPVKKI